MSPNAILYGMIALVLLSFGGLIALAFNWNPIRLSFDAKIVCAVIVVELVALLVMVHLVSVMPDRRTRVSVMIYQQNRDGTLTFLRSEDNVPKPNGDKYNSRKAVIHNGSGVTTVILK